MRAQTLIAFGALATLLPARASEALPIPIPVLGITTFLHAGYLLRCIRSIDHPVELLVVVHNGMDAEVIRALQTLQS